MALWLNLKRNKHYAAIYYKGEKVLEIRVDEQNRGNVTFLSLEADSNTTFKLVKEVVENDELDRNYNKEHFNK